MCPLSEPTTRRRPAGRSWMRRSGSSSATATHHQHHASRAQPARRAELDAAHSRTIIERVLPLFKITSGAAAVDPDFAALNNAMVARRRAEMTEAAAMLAGDQGLSVSPDNAAASLLVLYSPQVARILTESVGWSYDHYQTWLADAIERLILND